jgi:hypothetical protein
MDPRKCNLAVAHQGSRSDCVRAMNVDRFSAPRYGSRMGFERCPRALPGCFYADCAALASLEASSLLPAFKNLGRGVF